jgi:hypothetical protein
MKRGIVHFFVWAAGIVMIAGAILVVLIVEKVGVTRPTVYELPNGYRGWLQIRYEDPTCPPLATHVLFQSIRVASDGRGCTSGPMPRGFHYQWAKYLRADGSQEAAPSAWPLGHSDQRKLVLVFIGSEDEFRTSPRPQLR